MKDFSNSHFATKALHVGQGPDEATGAVVPPLHTATTFAQESVGITKGFEYSRSGNPTRQAWESCIAALENGRHGFAFASGLAATSTLLMTLSAGDHVLIHHDVYGGSFRLLNQVLTRFGITATSVDLRESDAMEQAIQPQTRLIWCETPSNPLLQIVDGSALVDHAHRHGLTVVVDNTFASPYLQQPLSWGADVVMHSSTKYLGGHSDILGGALVLNDDELAERIRFLQNSIGAVPSPFDCWMLLRSIKTLAVRIEQQSTNAEQIVGFLQHHPRVTAVHYPGLETHRGHDIAKRQMSRFGGMISFEVADEQFAHAVLKRLQLFSIAESLGAVESLADFPAVMTHASVPHEQRRAAGIADGLIRLSVGIEHIDDLIADLANALDG